MHCNNKENCYVAVGMVKGGGTRQASFHVQVTSADMDEMNFFFWTKSLYSVGQVQWYLNFETFVAKK